VRSLVKSCITPAGSKRWFLLVLAFGCTFVAGIHSLGRAQAGGRQAPLPSSLASHARVVMRAISHSSSVLPARNPGPLKRTSVPEPLRPEEQPVLLTDAKTGRAIALDSLTWEPEPFPASQAISFSLDPRTRLMLFAQNVWLQPGEGASSLIVQGRDVAGTNYTLTVEHYGTLPTEPSLGFLIVRLSDEMTDNTGEVELRVYYHGMSSNAVNINVGPHGSTPTPTPTPDPSPSTSPTPAPSPDTTPTPAPTATPTPLATPTPTPTPTPPTSLNLYPCLNGSGPLTTLSGDYVTPYMNTRVPANTRIDARLARWVDAGKVPFRVGGGANFCVEGGEIIGLFPLSTSWDEMHATYASQIRGGRNFLLENLRVHNYGDGFFIGSEDNSGFVFRGGYLSQIRDDAISNDYGWPGTIEDTLIDGTYVGFSDRGFTAASSQAIMEIRNTLVRLQTYDQTYNNSGPGHGWFWKFDSEAIKLSLHGNIFFAESPSIHSSAKLLPEKIVSCKKPDGSPDNTIVWTGQGPYPRPDELLTGCFTLTTDSSVWYKAVIDWKIRHNR